MTVPAFELARTELTWREWQLCEVADGCTRLRRPDFFNEIDISEQDSHPVVYVDIASVNEYVTWINEKTGRVYRLPSEAEWEYAARAGSITEYDWGDTIGEDRANCYVCSSEWDGDSTAPVGSFGANPFGLHDMHGNVEEWIADCCHDDYGGAPADGSAWIDNCTNANHRPLRGGSWNDVPEVLRAAHRYGINAGLAYNHVGFRLARTLP